MSRPRRAAAIASSSRSVPKDDQRLDQDPEYLALSTKQKKNIDRAFQRGIRTLQGESRKRRKVDRKVEEADQGGNGGLVDEEPGGSTDEDAGGGFMINDNEEGDGGFMVEDDDDDADGGFLPDTEEPSSNQVPNRSSPPTPSAKKRIPLHLLPSLLTSLGLPSDEDVLAVFKASASGWKNDNDDVVASRRKRGDEVEGGVELKDFRAVCAAIMGPEEEGSNPDLDEDEDDEDTFELPEDESDLSSLSDSEYGEISSNKRSKGRSSNKVLSNDFADDGGEFTPKKRGKKSIKLDELGKAKLSSRQKELAKDIWEMLKPASQSSSTEPNRTKGYRSDVLGRDELKKSVRQLGEMWTDDEITDMITLFSSQHEGRGLTFDDFGGVMLRAGLV
ncbi:uncharacterized protein IL334_001571 [Kwoniella shivajii]|uniref:Ribosome assembly protein 3 n=1 Tax=Kwoniella shivajii TaxID=564305 RepID=A0ABZ1CTG2_9TREE|nr:hypothetical protein IL334_001571 [Kwoniella shivajii]